MIPIFKVFMAEDVGDYVLPVLHSGYVGEGQKSQDFEKELGKFFGNDNILTVSSGTAAITLALRLARVHTGHEIITTPMTCLATNMPIISLGAKIVWADILPDGTIDPEDVARKINHKTRAIMCMDWGGLPCKLDDLKSFGITLIQDACQSIGAIYKGKPAIHDADFVCLSFQAIKYLTTVDGGALIINNHPKILEKGRLMRWFGLDRTQSVDMRCYQDPPVWGYKFQPNDVLASIGLANIRHLHWIVDQAKKHAEVYNKVLNRRLDPDRQSAYWLYTLLVKDQQKFIDYMKENGVMASLVHDRNDTKSIFAKSMTNLPGVDFFDKHHACIPVGWWLKEEEVMKIAELIEGRVYEGRV